MKISYSSYSLIIWWQLQQNIFYEHFGQKKYHLGNTK